MALLAFLSHDYPFQWLHNAAIFWLFTSLCCSQAKVFAEVVDITGIVLTKLDGTAKGGIVVAVQRELGVPVKLVGLGEGPDDLAPFDAAEFVDALIG